MGNSTKILGAGLMCIDIVHTQDGVKVMNGGSCANVISVLSQIGFDCSVVRERYTDTFEQFLSKTFSNLGVREILYRNTSSSTPKVIEILSDTRHEFLTYCPRCQEKILKLHLPTISEVENVIDSIREYSVFYCDRASSGIRALMDIVQANHGIVVYEPNSARNIESVMQNICHAGIVKFSAEKFSRSTAEKIRMDSGGAKLIIYTTGKDGLQYSHIQVNGEMSDWITVPSLFSGPIVDSSGAGDWLTAGFISELVQNCGCNDAKWFCDEKLLFNMLSQGMKYSGLCCAAVGAQGVFYSERSIHALTRLDQRMKPLKEVVLSPEEIMLDGLCPMCLSKLA